MRKSTIFASILIFNCGLVIAQNNAEENYIETLKKYSQYSEKEYTSIPDFAYQSETSIDLIKLRQKFNLDSIVGNGEELLQIISLLKWSHTSVRMIDNKNLTVSDGFNENGKPEGGSVWYLKYMSKNLFRFIIPIRSQSDYESSNMPSYIELLPLGYNAENVPIGEKIDKGTGYKYYIDNEKQFWR